MLMGSPRLSEIDELSDPGGEHSDVLWSFVANQLGEVLQPPTTVCFRCKRVRSSRPPDTTFKCIRQASAHRCLCSRATGTQEEARHTAIAAGRHRRGVRRAPHPTILPITVLPTAFVPAGPFPQTPATATQGGGNADPGTHAMDPRTITVQPRSRKVIGGQRTVGGSGGP